MNKKIKSELLSHFIYVFGSQLVVLISGLIKTLVIPVLLGLEDFGYWQIYIFYTLYIGIFTLGYGDGLFLKYGGYNFSSLPIRRIRSANTAYLVMLACGSAVLCVYALSNDDPNRKFVFLAISGNILILGVTSVISLTMQATNLLKGFAFINSADKIFFTLALLALTSNDFRTAEYLIVIDVIAKTAVLFILFSRYYSLFIGRLSRINDGILEFINCISSGGTLLIANLAGMLVLGVGRIAIEYLGDIDSYAYYALAVSLSNVVLMCITALTVIIYPALRRQDPKNYLSFFNKIDKVYFVFLIFMLFGYFPAVLFIEWVLEQYIAVLQFLNIVFVITVLQGKMQLVNNTFYKVLRLERAMLFANLTSLLIATILSFLAYYIYQNIFAIAYVACGIMLFRVYASEFFLRKYLKEKFSLRPLSEVVFLCVFILVTSFLGATEAAYVWLLIVVGIMYKKRRELYETWLFLRIGDK